MTASSAAKLRRCGACLVVAAATWLVPTIAKADGVALYPVAKASPGAAFHVSPDATSGAAFALDASVGMRVGLDYAGIVPVFGGELGYTHDSIIDLNAFQVAGSVGAGSALVFVTYDPRLIVGDRDGQFALGMRNGLTGHFYVDAVSLEIAHQFVDTGGVLEHDVRAQIGLNVGAIWGIAMLYDRAFTDLFLDLFRKAATSGD